MGLFSPKPGSTPVAPPRTSSWWRDAKREDEIWWDNNKPMSPAHFQTLYDDFIAHAADLDLFVQDLVGGADDRLQLAVAHHHRICLAFAFHPQPADQARARCARHLRPER